MRIVRKYWGLVVVLLVSFFALKPLFNSGYFPIHDSLQVERIYELTQALEDGHFPARWVKDLGYGYGYPLFNFYAPLPYHFGSSFYLLGFNLVVSTKIMFAMGILLAAVSMYFFAREIWGEFGGVLSAILYQYLPYHAVQIYVRGSVGEYWAYGFLPIFVLSLYQFRTKKNRNQTKKKWIFLGAFSYAAIILSHNITALLITILLLLFLVFFWIYCIFKNKKLLITHYSLLITVLLGLLLSAFFWLPAFFEKDLTQVNKVVQGGSYYADHFVQLTQLWNSPWGYGGSAPPEKIDGMSFKLGKIHIMLAIISSLLILLKRAKQKYLLLVICYLLLVSSIFMMLSISNIVWDTISLLGYSQFPWRFLMFAGFSLSVLGGGVLYVIRSVSKAGKMLFLLVVGFFLIVNFRMLPSRLEIVYFKPQNFYHVEERDFINDYNLFWIDSKRSDEYLWKNFQPPKDYTGVAVSRLPKELEQELDISINRTHMLAFNSDFRTNKKVKVNIGYFPGWRVYIDGEEVDIKILERGFLLNIPSGRRSVVVRFEDSFVRKVGNLISLLSLLLIFVYIRVTET